MNTFETALALSLCISLFVGPLLGYRAGVMTERSRTKRRPLPIGAFTIDSPAGPYIVTPSRAIAKQFAAKHGGTIIRVGRSE